MVKRGGIGDCCAPVNCSFSLTLFTESRSGSVVRALSETLVLVMGSNPSRVNPFLPKVFVTLERLTSVILEQLFERTKVGKQEEDDEEKEEEQEGDPAHKAKQAMSPQGLAHF